MSNIYERRSIRKYTDQAVGRTVIEEMIRAGAAAPSAKNRQPWKYLVYEGAAKEEFCNRMQKGFAGGGIWNPGCDPYACYHAGSTGADRSYKYKWQFSI